MNKIVYARSSPLRKQEYMISTTIELDINGKLFVYKRASSELAKKHLNKVLINYQTISDSTLLFNVVEPTAIDNRIRFDYVSGTRMDKLVIDYAIRNDISSMHSEIDRIIESICLLPISEKQSKPKDYAEVFGETFQKETTYIKLGYFDYNFDNFIKSDDKITLIDYEWLFDFDIPRTLILARMFYNLMLILSPIYKTKASENCPVVGIGDHGFVHEKTYKKYKKYFANIPEAFIAEQHLQNFVKMSESPVLTNIDLSTYTRHTIPIFPSLINVVDYFKEENLKLNNELTVKKSENLALSKNNSDLATEINLLKSSKTWRLRNKVRNIRDKF